MIQRRIAIKLGAAALAALALSRYEPSRRIWRGRGFGANLSVVFFDNGDDTSAMFNSIKNEVERLEHVFSLFRPNSAISRLNRDGQLRNPPEELVDVLETSKTIWTATEGVFDPTIQAAWHAQSQTPASPAGLNSVVVRHDVIQFNTPGTALTLNGIAQGYASDQLSRLMRRRGYAAHLVNLGEYSAGDGNWRLGIDNSDEQRLAHTDLDNLGLATSAPNAMTRGNGQSHIVHPFAKAPVWKTVSVQARTSALADGYSTALSLMPQAQIEAMNLRSLGIDKIWLESERGQVIRLG